MKGERLAEAQDIPLQFLEHILLELKHHGIVRARRGAKGGYWLARPAKEVTVADVIRAVEGPIAHVQSTPPGVDRLPRQLRAPAGRLDRGPREPPQRCSRRSPSPTSSPASCPKSVKQLAASTRRLGRRGGDTKCRRSGWSGG